MTGETPFDPEQLGGVEQEREKLEDFNTFLESLGECLEIQLMSNPDIINDLKENPLTFDQILQIFLVSDLDTYEINSWEDCDGAQRELILGAMRDFVNGYGEEMIIVDTENGPEITTK